MEASTPPPFLAEVEQAESRERSLDLDSDSELWDDTPQDENGDKDNSSQENIDQEYSDQEYSDQEYSDQEYSDQEYNDQEYNDQEYSDQEYSDQASCHDQTISSGELSLIKTESDLLSSSSHTLVHPTYTALRENCIRLLKILPIQADHAIRCRLETFSLDDKPTYTAISYTWGSQYGSHEVVVNDHPLLVPKNLWRFLNSAKAVGGDLLSWLWIDMLSISQGDIAERGHQVSLMPAIFRTANLVNVWLGPAYLESDAALITLARNSNTWKSPSQRRKLWASHSGPAIRELCHRPYWKRLWVYQELKLARQIQLMCGTKTIAWDQLKLFLLLAETDSSAKIPRLSGSAQDSVDSPAMKMVKLNSKFVHTHLWSLIQATQHLRCADIRDKAYALLGASTQGHGSVKPDYDLPIPTLINQILVEIYKLYPPESLEEALARCHEVEDVLVVPRGTVFTIRGQRGNYEVPREADFRACRLGPRETSLNLWWTAFYGHVAVQRLLLRSWGARCFDSEYSRYDKYGLTWNDTAVARNVFRASVVGPLSLDPYQSQLYSSFDSRYNAAQSTLRRNRYDWDREDSSLLDRCLEDVIERSLHDVRQSFRILPAPGGFLASQNDGVVDLLRAYAVHHDRSSLLGDLDQFGFVDDGNESSFFRPAIPPKSFSEQDDPFPGLDAERISRHHQKRFDTSTQHESPRNQRTENSPVNVVRLTLLSYVASRPSAGCISYFLPLRGHLNCDMDIQDENGWTPLIWAARYGNTEFISTVLRPDEAFCDVNYSDPNGWTAFEHAVAFSNTHIMSMILSTTTFDNNSVDSNGRTRLLEAVERCDLDMAKILLEEERCDPNIPDKEGRTPLTIAVSRCQAAPDLMFRTTGNLQASKDAVEYDRLIILLLKRPDLDVNLQDRSGMSALMVASFRGSALVVKVLLGSMRCDPDLVSQDGDTARNLALTSGHTEIVRLLGEGPDDPARIRWTTLCDDMDL